MAVPIVALYGSLNALLNILLALRVSGMRVMEKVSIGTGGNDKLELAARIHGNSAEFVPLAIVMLLVAELQGLPSVALHSLGGGLLLARVFHVVGMPRPAPNFFRFTGTAVTWLIVAGTSAWLLITRFR